MFVLIEYIKQFCDLKKLVFVAPFLLYVVKFIAIGKSTPSESLSLLILGCVALVPLVVSVFKQRDRQAELFKLRQLEIEREKIHANTINAQTIQEVQDIKQKLFASSLAQNTFKPKF